MTEPTPKAMTLRYALGWWAALVIIWGPRATQSARDGISNATGVFISLILITVLAYALARLGWRLGWFRKKAP